jgi:hypothetical protein
MDIMGVGLVFQKRIYLWKEVMAISPQARVASSINIPENYIL